MAEGRWHKSRGGGFGRKGRKPYSTIFCQPKEAIICRRKIYKKWKFPALAREIVQSENLGKRPKAREPAKAYLASRLKLELFKRIEEQNQPLSRAEEKLKALLNNIAFVAQNVWQHYDGKMPRQAAIKTHAAATSIATIIPERTQLFTRRAMWGVIAKAHDFERKELALSKKRKPVRWNRQELSSLLNVALIEADKLRSRCRKLVSVGCQEINRIVDRVFEEIAGEKQRGA